MPAFPFPVGAIAFLTGIFYLNFVSRVMLGPFLPLIEQELGLGHGGAGSLFFFIQIGYAAGLLGSAIRLLAIHPSPQHHHLFRRRRNRHAGPVPLAFVGRDPPLARPPRDRGGTLPSLRHRDDHPSEQRGPLGKGARHPRAGAEPGVRQRAAARRGPACRHLVARGVCGRGMRGNPAGWLFRHLGPRGGLAGRAAPTSECGARGAGSVPVGDGPPFHRRDRERTRALLHAAPVPGERGQDGLGRRQYHHRPLSPLLFGGALRRGLADGSDRGPARPPALPHDHGSADSLSGAVPGAQR